MNENARKMRELLTKFNLHADDMFNQFDGETLTLMLDACRHLDVMLRCEMEVITSVTVKAMVLDDIAKLESNVKVIKATIKFKMLELEGFCMN